MHNRFIIPNFHVILIHYPLALLAVGILIELLAFLWRRSTVRAAGKWMILLGALSLVPAATSGLYALANVNRTERTPVDATWSDVRATSPVQGHAWDMLQQHAWLNAFGTAVFLLVVVLWLGSSDTWRARLHFPLLFVLVVGMGILVAGAWHGGEMVYRHRIAVLPDEKTAETAEKRGVTDYVPPLESHVILAGLAVAVGIASIGLSLRKSAPGAGDVTRQTNEIGAALNSEMRSVGYVEVTPELVVRRQPVARFWLLGALLGIATALTGWWFLAIDAGTWDPKTLWGMVADTSTGPRRLAHVITGVGLVVWMLLMALIGRMAAGRKIVIGFFSLALVAAVILQIWFGSLLLMDSSSGTPWRFNASTTQPTSEPTAPTTEPAAPTTTASMR